MSMLSDKLDALGMSYKEYLRSDHWRRVRERYYQSKPKECWVCGATDGVTLHHQTYERLGEERMHDLVPLCGPHHDRFHKENKGLGNLRKQTKRFVRSLSKQETGMRRCMNGKIRVKDRNSKKIVATLEEAKAIKDRLKRISTVAKGKLVSMEGPKCKRCANAMAVVKHPPEWTKPDRAKFYYEFWYKCLSKKCRTTLVMPPEGKVHR